MVLGRGEWIAGLAVRILLGRWLQQWAPLASRTDPDLGREEFVSVARIARLQALDHPVLDIIFIAATIMLIAVVALIGRAVERL